MRRLHRHVGTLVALLVLFAAGLVAAAYVLAHERFPNPFANTYPIHAQLQAADGIVPGLGQPVNVAGVAVGEVTGARLDDGLALITMSINRNQVPHVYADANAALDPITPLGDVEINLSPGGPPAAKLPNGGTVPLAQTSSPVQLEDLLSNLNTSTRTWLGSLLASLGQGTAGQADNIRASLGTLGPTVSQVHTLTAALATRRHALAQLVHNIALVTKAASEDHQLSKVVVAGDQTLRALASQDVALRQSVSRLPGAVAEINSTLIDLRPFAEQLAPTLASLTPAVKRLPTTLEKLTPFAADATNALQGQVRPLVQRATPLLSALAPAINHLSQATPDLTDAGLALHYFVNELAYNPQHKNQGYLYWLDWFFHNWNSLASSGDANGPVARADVVVNCSSLANMVQLGTLLEAAIGAGGVC